MYSVLHLADAIARFFPRGTEPHSQDGGPNAIRIALEGLGESSQGFPVAEIMQEMVRRTANLCSIRIPTMLDHKSGSSSSQTTIFQMADFIDACTRPSYVQPFDQICQRYLPSISGDWLINGVESRPRREVEEEISAEVAGAQNLMHISNLLNSN